MNQPGHRIAIMALCAVGSLALSACAPPASSSIPPVLLFNGTGASPNDVKAIEAILARSDLDYATADSAQLNSMTTSELARRRLLIIPGGNYIEIGESLTPAAAGSIRDAVHGGLNYLGICAGALVAGDAPTRSLNLTDGVRFDFYGVVNQNVHKAAVAITDADAGGGTLDQYWEDGPQLSGWGAAIAHYPDGTPAVAESACGKGWVVLCGFHPEAPESWREGMTFRTPASRCHGYAAKLIVAALNRTALAEPQE